MPVLEKEEYCWPPGLLGDSGVLGLPGWRWSVLRTRARAEKAILRQLISSELGCYLPQKTRRRKMQRRVVESSLPLFPGYVFIVGDEQSREQSVRVRGVAQCLPVEDQQGLQESLRQVQRVIDSGVPFWPEERLEPGERVEIVEGPLKGVIGRVARRGSSERIIVEVDLLQQGVSVELDIANARRAC